MAIGNVTEDVDWTAEETHLLDLFCFEDVLEDFEIGDKFVFVLGIHLNSRHGYIGYWGDHGEMQQDLDERI